MTHFEESQALREELMKFSDEALLLELRRRGRFQRIEASHINQGFRLRLDPPQVPPPDYVWPMLGKEVGYEIGKAFAAKRLKIPGAKTEMGHFQEFSSFYEDERYVLPINFVVDI